MITEKTSFPDKTLEVLARTKRRRDTERATSADGLLALAALAETQELGSSEHYMLVPGTTDVWIHADAVPDVPFNAGHNVTTAIIARAAQIKRLAPDQSYWEQHLESQAYQGV